jgi:protocatechuate 4,5-dioxygenase, beta chain
MKNERTSIFWQQRMAKIVATVGMTHRPTIYRNWNAPPESAKSEALNSFAKLRKRLEEASPDVILMVANDHIDQFFVDDMPSFCVGISDKTEGPFPIEHEQGVPNYRSQVDGNLSRFVLAEGLKNNLDFARVSDFRLDHAFVVPLSFISPEGRIPIVPIFTNVLVPPIPSIKRFHDLGSVLSNAIDRYDSTKRVAVVGSINFSVEVAGPRHAKSDEEFDKIALNVMKSGTPEDFYRNLDLKRIAMAGNASGEFLNYLVLLGISKDNRPAMVECPMVPRWGSCPTVAWD